MDTSRNPLLACIGLLTALLATILLYLSVDICFFLPLVVGLGCVATGCARMTVLAKARATTIGLILCVIAAIGPFALAEFTNRSGKPIRVVLPVGFRGEISIIKDRAKGQDLKTQDGVWVFEIPASGVLVVNDDHPFYMWHQATYVYSDGHPAVVESLGVTAGTIQAWPSGWRGSTEYDGTTHRWKVVAPR